MLAYILRRIGIMIPTLFIISVISFIVIQLPPGDFLTSYSMTLRSQGEYIQEEEIANLRIRYGFGQPVYVQYAKWIWGIVTRGDWGQSMEWQRPVNDLIWERMALTVVLSLVALFVSWFIAIPLGVYSATHQYSILDYIATS
jgi:peptide/nickel transport system permease protein